MIQLLFDQKQQNIENWIINPSLRELSVEEMQHISGGAGFLGKLQKLSYLDSLIRQKRTGGTEDLAKKMRVSRSHTLNYLREDLEAPIKFDKYSQNYYYESEWNLEMGLKNKSFFKSLKKLDSNYLILQIS